MRLDFCVACGHRADLNHHHAIPRVLDGPDDESNLITLCRECHGLLHDVEWQIGHSDLIKAGLQAAKARGVKLGGTNAQSIANRDEARQRAEELRPILTELAGMSANKAAVELNKRGVATPKGGHWHALTVMRLRQRLAA